MGELVAGASAVGTLILGLLTWSLQRNVKAMDTQIAEAKKTAAEANAKVVELEKHEFVHAMKDEFAGKFENISKALAAIGSDVAVLKDRDQNTRVEDREPPPRRRRRS